MQINSKDNPYSEGSTQNGFKKTFGQWGGKLGIAFTFIHTSHDIIAGLLVALLPFIREDLDLNYLQTGFLVSAFSIAAGLFQFVGGWLCDRMSRRKAITLGLGGVGLCAMAISFANSYYALLAILIVMGMLSGFYHPSAISALTNIYEESQRGKVMALHNIGGSIGFGIGPLLGALIASRLNWHYAYTFIGLPALVAATLVFTRLKISLDGKKTTKSISSPIASSKPGGLLSVFKSVGVIMAISLAIALISGPITSFISLFMVDIHQLSPAATSIWITIIRIGSMVGGLFGGWLSDKWGRLKVLFVALILIGPVAFFLTRVPFGAFLVISFILFGLLMTMRETTMQTYLMDKSPPYLRATVYGIYFGFAQEGSSIIQPIAGDFMDAFGIGTVYSIIAYIVLGLSFLTLVIALRNARGQHPVTNHQDYR